MSQGIVQSGRHNRPTFHKLRRIVSKAKSLLGAVCLLEGVSILFVLGCGSKTTTQVVTPSLTITGPQQLRVGQAGVFKVSAISQPAISGLEWSVNGVIGGTASSGTIDTSGHFTAPEKPEAVTISCDLQHDRSVHASIEVQVLNPVPVVSSVSVDGVVGTTGTITLAGSGFVPQSTVTVNRTATEATVISDHEIHTSAIPLIPGSTLEVVVSNPSPGASESNVANIVTPQASLGELAGCDNPNNGQAVSGFGTSTSPVYIDSQRMRSLIGTPSYNQNAVYWSSRETAPGQSILLSGAFTSSVKQARVAEIGAGATDWQTIVNTSTTLVPTKQQGTTGLSFKVPVDFKGGVFAYKIEDPSAPPVFGIANVPSIVWLLGVPSSAKPESALQSAIHPCAVEQGEQIRIFGKNFRTTDELMLQSITGEIIELSTELQDPTSILASVPSTVPSGSYFAWVGSRTWDVTSSAAVPIQVLPAARATVAHKPCSDLIPDGSTDNTARLQHCLESSSPSLSANQIVFVDLPPGRFAIRGNVAMLPGELLSGSGADATEIVGISSDKQPQTWITVPRFGGILNLSVVSPGDSNLVASADCSGNPASSGHIYIGGASFVSSQGSSAKWFDAVKLCGPDVQIHSSHFGGTPPSLLSIVKADGAIVEGNTFEVDLGVAGFQGSQNVIVESNSFTASLPIRTMTGNTALWISRPFSSYGPSYVSQNFYIASNSFNDMGSTSNQPVITTDGGGGAYYGLVAASTSDTVTLANDPGWEWTGVTWPKAAYMVILYGTGVGQYSPITSWSDRTIHLQWPWQVAPDTSSIVEIVSAHRNLTLVHNEFLNNINVQVNFGNVIDAAIEDNRVTNSQYAFSMASFGPYGGPAGYGPFMNADVLRNIVSAGNDTLMYHQKAIDNYRSGIGVYNGAGTIVSGVMIRNNQITKEQSIYSTNGCGGVSAVVIEQNEARWVDAGCNVPGFLAQENSDPK